MTKIALDISPISNNSVSEHKVRGTGTYTFELRNALLKFFPENSYTFFTRGENLPKDIDLVHFPYFEPFFLTLPIKKNKPTIVTAHDLTPLVFPREFPVGIKGSFKWQVQKYSLKSSSAIITDSESSKRDIIRLTGIKEDKITVVYLAPSPDYKQLEDGSWKKEIQQKYNLPDNFILYVGDVTWNKNLPRLIEAIKKTQKPFVMVGKALVNENFDKNNPWNKDLVRIQTECRKNKNIIRLGFIPQEDLIKIYNLATVFVMPSLYEGFGLPVLEAMACGCPVITSNASSLPEIVGQAANYVNPQNIEEITSKILSIFKLSDEERQQLIEKGLGQVKNFSWEKTAKETISVYEKVLR